MAEILTVFALLAAVALVARAAARRFSRPRILDVSVHLDRSAPGAHLIWDIANVSQQAVTLGTLVVHGRHANQTLPFGQPHVLAAEEHLLMPTDVDWSLLGARSIAVVDAGGREHVVAHRQLVRVQEQLHTLIDRRSDEQPSARDWLFGATDLAFGAVLLGLGFFLLIYVIATG